MGALILFEALGSAGLPPTAIARPAVRLDATYVNARFGFTVRYPSAAFVARPEAPSGDGRELAHRGGRGHVLAFGSLMPEDREDLERSIVGLAGRVTYHVSRPTWFVVSGHRAARRDVYHKVVRGPGCWWHLVFEYDAAAAATFRPLIEAIRIR